MNTTVHSPAAPQARPAAGGFGFGHKYKLLLKREFWENRGGFLWAPIITGVIACIFAIIGMVGGSMALHEAKEAGKVDWSHRGIIVDGGEEATRQAIGGASDVLLMSGIGIALAVMVFVIFFYALGSLYDERRDRSVLFWKSLPISDTTTVLSKVSWALLLAPVLSIGVGVAIGLAMMLLMCITMVLNGMPHASALLLEASPLRVIGGALGMLPVYAMWSLPTVGWLMLCSAWARRLPFLWAVLVPIVGCTMVSMMAGISGAMSGTDFPYGEMWYAVVYRGLLSIVPMAWNGNPEIGGQLTGIEVKGPQDLTHILDLSHNYSVFGTADLWIGAAVGIAMIVVATRLRRWRDEG